MAHVVFTTIGSSGDLFPLLPVARAVEERGHVVRFAANPSFRSDIERAGLSFQPIGPELGAKEYAAHPEILDPGMGGLVGIRALMRTFVLPHLERVALELEEASQDADLLVSHPAQLAAPMVAERLGLPRMTLTVFPGNIPSRTTVPQGALSRARGGPLGRFANGLAWTGGRLALRQFDRPLNAVRARLGLPAARDVFFASGLEADQVVVLCDPAYCGAPADWGDHTRVVGYTLFDTHDDYEEPARLGAFLDAGDPPVLLSLGTSVSVDPGRFHAHAEAALDEIGVRGLFLAGSPENMPAERNGRHGYFEYVPLSRVLPRCRAIVHPGGFGTTGAALCAGIPQVVVPRAFDQPYHADRLATLGVGRVIPWGKLSPQSLGRALSETLDDAALASRAAAFAASLNPGTGVPRAADLISESLPEKNPK